MLFKWILRRWTGPSETTAYKLIMLEDGRDSLIMFHAKNDREAQRSARSHAAGRAAELWAGGRLIDVIGRD
jgi:hypothetical protein